MNPVLKKAKTRAAAMGLLGAPTGPYAAIQVTKEQIGCSLGDSKKYKVAILKD